LSGGVAELAPPPRPQPAEPRPISPDEPKVAGFVFKVQANIDPQHRDRIAFVRIASGRSSSASATTPRRLGSATSSACPPRLGRTCPHYFH
jgi:peptide chain release factor 3